MEFFLREECRLTLHAHYVERILNLQITFFVNALRQEESGASQVNTSGFLHNRFRLGTSTLYSYLDNIIFTRILMSSGRSLSYYGVFGRAWTKWLSKTDISIPQEFSLVLRKLSQNGKSELACRKDLFFGGADHLRSTSNFIMRWNAPLGYSSNLILTDFVSTTLRRAASSSEVGRVI